MVQRPEDRADAGEAAFSKLPALRTNSGSGRNYLALWTLQSPDAFKTEQYTTDWGFFEWAPHITDWSRDLFDGGDTPEQAFAVPAQGGLHIVSFDGASPDEAAAARGAVATSQPDMVWLPVIGLDRHTPIMGVRVLRDGLPRQLFQGGPGHWQEATYRPVSEFATAD